MTKNKQDALIPVEHIAQSILILRGQRVLLDRELASLYRVQTKRLNEQVKRNIDRFPKDFMFRLTRAEIEVLNRSQTATGSQKHRDPRFAPYAFTEHGAIMAATILNSPRAIEMSIYVVRAFVQLRDLLASNRQLAEKFAELERKVSSHDQAIVGILKAIRELMHTPEPKTRPIGFTANLDGVGRQSASRSNPSSSVSAPRAAAVSVRISTLFDISMTFSRRSTHLGACLRSHAHHECIRASRLTRVPLIFRHSGPARSWHGSCINETERLRTRVSSVSTC